MIDLKHKFASDEAATNDLLQRLLSGKASVEDRANWERISADSPLLQDALEGLQGIQDPAMIEALQLQINSRLHRNTLTKRRSKLRRITSDPVVITITVVLLLLAAISVYLLISNSKSPV
jgi:ferric-dicitrate binding protein FerR (iron transport regulator)